MSKMIRVESGFQYSVNIGYDLNHDDKLKNFIPTKSAVQMLKDILLSTNPNSTDRARILIGAYGKGKSHIVLTILSILMQRPRELFVHLMPKIEEDPELKQLVDNYYDVPGNKILPIIISGTSSSLPQAFLLALQRTLNENNLDLMPETNYKAAIKSIEKWERNYPQVFEQFKKEISIPIEVFLSRLEDYDVEIYEEFEKIYPTLTAGSTFNPFVGFDVVDLYESVAKSLKEKGYLGLCVIYDEFSKYLEANIHAASVSDTKMLQDFAEKCNRSGDAEMHLLLISHKEISNYIDQLPKQKVDGWRGISERFQHIHLNNNFAQTYEIISSVIIKEHPEWDEFCKNPKNKSKFKELERRYKDHALFNDSADNELDTTIFGCYPLHPVSTFILPRLSERIAQNERTLFTFLSADGPSTLSSFLRRPGRPGFRVITPDLIFDYFNPVFQKEAISGEIHKNYVLTMMILDKIKNQELESKIVKTLSLIYTLGQFDKLKPIKEELVGIYEMDYSPAEIESAIDHLVKDEYVIYLKRSNGYLKLKQTSGVDIEQKISDEIVSLESSFSMKEALKFSNIDNYLYPSRYNDEKEMIRFFEFEFVEEQEIDEDVDWSLRSEGASADGMVYAIVPDNNESIGDLKRKILTSSRGCERCIFIVPKKATSIKKTLKEYLAAQSLRDSVKEDMVLFEEYEVIYEDLRDVINEFISGYTHPEEYKSIYVYNGEQRTILRKSALTGLASEICHSVFSETPVINNEAINRDDITSIANNSRSKIISGLLRNTLESNLGLTGTGQEVSIMRSALIRKGVLVDDGSVARIDLNPSDRRMKNVLDVIVSFVMESKKKGSVSFADLYERLVAPRYHIGLRSGVIPIYLAAVFHEFHEDIILENDKGQLPMTADTLQTINMSPAEYRLKYLDWNPQKQQFVLALAEMFEKYIVAAERELSAYDYVASAMKRWYLGISRFAKETNGIGGKPVKAMHNKMVALLKQNLSGQQLLFEKLPEVFGYQAFNDKLVENILEAKEYFDHAVANLTKKLVEDTKEIFSISSNKLNLKMISLSSVIQDWCETLDVHAFEQLFEDGTDKCLGLFKSVTNDEGAFIGHLAKIATDLRIEDWNDGTEKRYVDNLKRFRKTAESFHVEKAGSDSQTRCAYEIHFRAEDGTSEVKRFDRVEPSKKGKLLYNSVMAEIDSMGLSISDHEKRQILMDIIEKLC